MKDGGFKLTNHKISHRLNKQKQKKSDFLQAELGKKNAKNTRQREATASRQKVRKQQLLSLDLLQSGTRTYIVVRLQEIPFGSSYKN